MNSIQYQSEFKHWAVDIIGKKLHSVWGLIYTYNGKKDYRNPQAIDVHFDKAISGRLFCHSNGSSLGWESERSKENDLGKYGKEKLENISFNSLWRGVIGKTLTKIQLLESSIDHYCIGLKFSFDNSLSIHVMNLGDELFTYKNIPLEILEQEKFRCLHIPNLPVVCKN